MDLILNEYELKKISLCLTLKFLSSIWFLVMVYKSFKDQNETILILTKIY